MQTLCRSNSCSTFWVRFLLAVKITVLLGLSGCASSMANLKAGEHRDFFLQKLAADPKACKDYRESYVNGFQQNVRALALDDETAQQEANQNLSEVRANLKGAGLTETDCSRPYCIIEPLQNGRLDSWCGYRLDADEGEELYQWLDWVTVQAAVQRLQ